MSEEFDGDDAPLPKFVAWSTDKLYNFSDQTVDFSTLDEYNAALAEARTAMFKLNERINDYERKERLAKVKYDRAYRRAYLSSSEKTESAKRSRAELKCEHLENDLVILEQLNKELQRTAYVLRQELQALQTVGNNLRQQLKIL